MTGSHLINHFTVNEFILILPVHTYFWLFQEIRHKNIDISSNLPGDKIILIVATHPRRTCYQFAPFVEGKIIVGGSVVIGGRRPEVFSLAC